MLVIEAVLQIRLDQARLSHGGVAHNDALDRRLLAFVSWKKIEKFISFPN